MVVLADGITPVTLGETLTVAQLIGLKFRPTANARQFWYDLDVRF
jgi:hypothetical protein